MGKAFRLFDEALKTKKKWSVIYADPPWDFSNRNLKRSDGKLTNVKDYYRTSGLQGLKDMPVADLASDTAALLMWTTDAHIEWALDLGKHWGFKFATVQFTWLKLTTKGKPVQVMGPWGMKSCENCLLFTKGRARSELLAAHNVRQYHAEARGEHSAKPEYFALEIERMFGSVPRLELFARASNRPGWDFLGDEL